MRSREDAIKLAGVLEIEAAELPEFSFFGDNNADAIANDLDYAKALREYAESGHVPLEQNLAEVKLWLRGKFSALDDYASE